MFFSSKEKQTIESIVEKYNPKVKASLQNNFAKNNIESNDFEMAILAFKKEQILEVVVRKNENESWKLLKIPVGCNYLK